jgi:hypothetical protein
MDLKSTIVRMVSMVLNLVAVFVVLAQLIGATRIAGSPWWGYIFFIVTVGLLGFLLKSEYDWLDDHRPMLLAVTIAVLVALQALVQGLLDAATILFGVAGVVSLVAVIVAWHFTLSIYLKEKKVFVAAVAVFFVVYYLVVYAVVGLWAIVPGIIVGVATIADLVTEQVMIKKKQLNYVRL